MHTRCECSFASKPVVAEQILHVIRSICICCVTNTCKHLPSFAFAEWQFFFFIFPLSLLRLWNSSKRAYNVASTKYKKVVILYAQRRLEICQAYVIRKHNCRRWKKEKRRGKLIGHWSRIWFQWFVDIACDSISLSPARSPFLSHFWFFVAVECHASKANDM